jgi:pimeloyl-ACP methyl ester carboxylesterase
VNSSPTRRRTFWATATAATAVATTMLVTLPFTSAAASPGHGSRQDSGHCRTARYPVTIPAAGDGQITGDYCTPRRSNGTLLLMAGGGGENANYWNMPTLPGYSLVRAATQAGYATLAVDRLGTGRSTTPVSTEVTYAAQVSTIHQVITALHRQGWNRIVGVGHSLGSGAMTGVAAQHPGDLTALAVTGYGPAVSPQTAQRNALYQKAASTVNPTKWGSLDDGYVTTAPADVPYSGSLYLPGVTQTALTAVETHQGIHTKTELTTRPQGDAAAAQGAAIRQPTLLLDGQEDDHYCTVNAIDEPLEISPTCATQGTFHAYGHAMFPNAPLTTYLAPRTGHSTEVHTSAPATNRLILAWVARAVAAHR